MLYKNRKAMPRSDEATFVGLRTHGDVVPQRKVSVWLARHLPFQRVESDCSRSHRRPAECRRARRLWDSVHLVLPLLIIKVAGGRFDVLLPLDRSFGLLSLCGDGGVDGKRAVGEEKRTVDESMNQSCITITG